MQVGTVQNLISVFDRSFSQLGVKVSLEKLEDLSVTIHRAMTVQTRHFHTLEHVFNFVDPHNAIVSLAALYHDIVYHQVDKGFSPHIWELISPYVWQEDQAFIVAEHVPASDRLFFLTLDIFELLPGQKLTSAVVLNEFLSALVMNKQLDGLVSDRDLARMMLCIEATIPFRGTNGNGKNHFDLLELRLPEVFARHNLHITGRDLVAAIKTAAAFANKDIENFAEKDPGRFLDNTWKLLPETNAALRLPDVYSIRTYRQALQKMSSFFENLNPDSVFSQYHGMPHSADFDRKVQQAGKNIRVARTYLGIKILAITVLEALALATGGDAPLSLFLGDIPREGLSVKRLEYFLPELDYPEWVQLDPVMHQLFESGRSSVTSFEVRNSPLVLFIYKSVPPDRIAYFLQRARDFHTGQLSPEEFLSLIGPAVVQPVARASSIMVYTRRQALLKFAGGE